MRARIILACVLGVALSWVPTVAKAGDRGFAVWHGTSTNAAGTLVSAKKYRFIDSAFLQPRSAYRLAEPIVDFDRGNKILLAAGGMLAEMEGGLEGRFCTWKHGKRLSLGEDWVPQILGGLYAQDIILCAELSPDGTLKNVYTTSARNGILLRVKDPIWKTPRRTNAARVEKIDPADYHKIAMVGVVASRATISNQQTVCLNIEAGSVGHDPDVTANAGGHCFKGINTTGTVGNGVYTLISFDDKSIVIRIDRPFSFSDFSPLIAYY